MKGRIDLRYDLPNLSKVRTRLETIPTDFTQAARAALAEAVQEVCDEQQTAIKAKVIEKLGVSGLAKKEHEAALTSVSKDFFTSFYAIGAEAAKAKFGGAAEENEEVPGPAEAE